jgi:hypothetical protein
MLKFPQQRAGYPLVLLVLGLIVASGRSFTMFMHLEQVWLGLVFSSNVSASNMVMGLVIVVILLWDSEASPWRTHDGEGLNTSKIICQTRCCQNAATVHGLPYCGLSVALAVQTSPSVLGTLLQM